MVLYEKLERFRSDMKNFKIVMFSIMALLTSMFCCASNQQESEWVPFTMHDNTIGHCLPQDLEQSMAIQAAKKRGVENRHLFMQLSETDKATYLQQNAFIARIFRVVQEREEYQKRVQSIVDDGRRQEREKSATLALSATTNEASAFSKRSSVITESKKERAQGQAVERAMFQQKFITGEIGAEEFGEYFEKMSRQTECSILDQAWSTIYEGNKKIIELDDLILENQKELMSSTANIDQCVERSSQYYYEIAQHKKAMKKAQLFLDNYYLNQQCNNNGKDKPVDDSDAEIVKINYASSKAVTEAVICPKKEKHVSFAEDSDDFKLAQLDSDMEFALALQAQEAADFLAQQERSNCKSADLDKSCRNMPKPSETSVCYFTSCPYSEILSQPEDGGECDPFYNPSNVDFNSSRCPTEASRKTIKR